MESQKNLFNFFLKLSKIFFQKKSDIRSRATVYNKINFVKCKMIYHFTLFLQPQAIVLTGDLTDAKTKDKLGSTQFEAEWNMYQETMHSCGAFDTDSDQIWLDIRGNHDTFNTRTHKNDFYSKFGIRRKDTRMYSKIIKSNNVSYGFVGMDATLAPGPKRPFNFFGSLSLNELEKFQEVLDQTR